MIKSAWRLDPRRVPEDDDSIIHDQSGQSSSLVIGRRLQWLKLNPTQHDRVRVVFTPDKPGSHLEAYYLWMLSTVDGLRPNRHICRIGITYLVRCLKHIKYAQTTRHIPHTHGDDIRVVDEQGRVAIQDRWDFYNVYPQVVSILGEEEVERHGSRETLPSRCYIDEQGDTDVCPVNDSGIDIDLIQPPRNEEHRVDLGSDILCRKHDNAAYGRSEWASHVRYRWSVDETIALHLLEAMESRQTDVQGSVNRGRKKKRIGHRLRQKIVAFFREIRTRYL